jgi:hypothetical protein
MNSESDKPSYDSVAGLAAALQEAVHQEEFPQYGYGVVQAAALASRLGIDAMSVLELGVAGGNGLVRLQQLCRRYAAPGLALRAFGFDLAQGLPRPRDHRDMPYVWQAGFFAMQREVLEARLEEAELILGDVAQTGRAFLASAPAPIGFIAFDLDYYSSTCAAFDALLLGEPERYLPRVICYFDDTIGPHLEMHSQFTGELLAIDQFNAEQRQRKLAKLSGLRYKLAPYDAAWIEGIYVLHLFDHPRYDEYVYPVEDRQFPLRSAKADESRG